MASEKPPPPAINRKRKAPSTTSAPPTKEKGPTAYTKAVGTIRSMFSEQASLWDAQAQRLQEAAGIPSLQSSVSKHEPWSFLMDEKGRPTSTIYGNMKTDGNDEESNKVDDIKKKIKRTKQWRYERPMEEEDKGEEGSSGAKQPSSDEESDA